MSALPDELWRQILELGVNCSSLSYKDLCCISMTCIRLNRISNEDVVWSKLFSSDFPGNPLSLTDALSPKSLYKRRFEKDKAKKLLAEKRAVLRIESQIHEHIRKLQDIERRLVEENEKMRDMLVELSNLRKAREASAALKVWQPEVIRSRQKQIVEHYSVPVDSRINVLEMEVKLCKQQISGLQKARRDESDRLEAAKDRLSKVKYRPLQNLEGVSSSSHNDKSKNIRKKFKRLKQM